jgi:hypothetical protein
VEVIKGDVVEMKNNVEYEIKTQYFALISGIIFLIAGAMETSLLGETLVYFETCKSDNSGCLLAYKYSFFFILFIIWFTSGVYLLLIPLYKQKADFLWHSPKNKPQKKINLSVDVHKSPFWKKEKQVFLCVHNDNWFYPAKNVSIGVALLAKYEDGKSTIINDRSEIMVRYEVISKRSVKDYPLLTVAEKENSFCVGTQKPISGLLPGKYVIQIWVGNELQRIIPINIIYEGKNNIFVETLKIASEISLLR